jgi:signal transduction histidine kinase
VLIITQVRKHALLIVLIFLALGLMAAIGMLGAPGHSPSELLLYLFGGGLISLGCGFVCAAWLRGGNGPIWLQIALAYGLGLVIAIANIFFNVQLMIISSSALPLLILLLLFAAIISLGLGLSLAQAISSRVSLLNRSAQSLASGDLSVRVEPQGSDELAELAHEFNSMAEQLAAAARERAQQESARRDLIAAVSHDLRTPLASLSVLTDAIADGLVDDPATLERYRATMRSQVEHLSHLIDDLFELSRLDAQALALDKQRMSVGDLVSDTINALRPEASEKGVILCGTTLPGAGVVLLDPQRIERVLYNLVSNALRHTPAGGQVQISVGPDEQNRQQMRFAVADTGEGIAAEDLPHVFERFYRGEKSRNRATGGTGLGLAIARGIVEAHGGCMGVESERGKGALFWFTIPVV